MIQNPALNCGPLDNMLISFQEPFVRIQWFYRECSTFPVEEPTLFFIPTAYTHGIDTVI